MAPSLFSTKALCWIPSSVNSIHYTMKYASCSYTNIYEVSNAPFQIILKKLDLTQERSVTLRQYKLHVTKLKDEI